MDNTPNLALPYIIAAQAQKHVTHNEAIRALDAILQLMVLDKDLASPPGAPADGDRYIVASSPTGAWSGQAGKVAAYQDGAWAILAPREGWLAWVADEDTLYAYGGSAWAIFAGGGGGSGREVLSADRTYYVRTDGSDANDGLANTAGGAFLTLQKGYDVIAGTLDLGGHTVTVQVGNGTYTAGLLVSQPWTGGGAVTFQGDTSTPSNVVVSLSGASCFKVTAVLPGTLRIKGFKGVITSGTFLGVIYHVGGGVVEVGAMEYGAVNSISWHIVAGSGAYVHCVTSYTVSGTAAAHVLANAGGYIAIDAITATISGSPTITDWVYATRLSLIEYAGGSFSGSPAAGTRKFFADLNAVIYSSGLTFPGSVAGATTSGGQYL